MELSPTEMDYLAYNRFAVRKVQTLAILGEMNSAFALAEEILRAGASQFSIPKMEVTPGYENMLQDPRWPALAEKYRPEQ